MNHIWTEYWTELHSSVGRASHRYREITGSNPFEVLNFFQASLRNCINCVSLRRSFLHFIIVILFLTSDASISVRSICTGEDSPDTSTSVNTKISRPAYTYALSRPSSLGHKLLMLWVSKFWKQALKKEEKQTFRGCPFFCICIKATEKCNANAT